MTEQDDAEGPVRDVRRPLAVGSTYQSLTTQVFQELRERIIEGLYPPGTRLPERELSEDLQVSRIPIREALPRLEAEGYIVTMPRRGAIVRQLTLRDIEELFDLRITLEVFAARQAALRAQTTPPGPQLRELVARALEFTEQHSEHEISSVNSAIHEEIVRLAGNDLLGSVMQTIMGRSRWLFRLTTQRDQSEQYREHTELADAIYAGDVELSGAIAYSHIQKGRAPSIALLHDRLPAE